MKVSEQVGCQKVFIHPEDIEGDESAELVGCQKVFIHPEDIEGDESVRVGWMLESIHSSRGH